jgi:hypothetical protein
MRGVKPNKLLWEKINLALLDANLGEAIVTIVSGLSQLIIHAGAAKDEHDARVMLCAMVLSPDDLANPGGLLPRLQAEILRLDDKKWIT